VEVVDWREPSLPPFDAIWREQSARWDALFWDSRENWDLIERHRRDRRLPGLALLDRGAIAGWTFFVTHQDTLQVGGFESCSERATEVLLDAVDALAEPPVAGDGALLFTFSSAPGLEAALGRSGYAFEHYLYLVRTLDDVQDGAAGLRWNADAQQQLASLFGRAYGRPSLTRPFARHGAAQEWQEYSAQLVQLHACGKFLHDVSAASFSSTGELQGAVVATAVHPRTVHIAQLSVDPLCQRRGIAQAMMNDVLANARAAGYELVSLLVGAANRRARELYSKLGFAEAGRFTSAGRGRYPRRSTSPAAVTGGASTLR
jgi:ribosomal protein S18 acetylase RimI-like enzyme